MCVLLKKCQKRWLNVNILSFHEACKDKTFSACVAKIFPFLSSALVFHIVQLMWTANHQSEYDCFVYRFLFHLKAVNKTHEKCTQMW